MMKKGIFSSVLAIVLIAAVFILPIVNTKLTGQVGENSSKIDKSPSVITPKPPESSSNIKPAPKSDQTVTFIITAEGNSLLDTALSFKKQYANLSEMILSGGARAYLDTLKKNQAVVKASIKRIIPQTNFDNCYTYNTVLNGFTVKAPYSCLEKLRKIDGVKSVMLSTSAETRISSLEQDFSKSQLNISEMNTSGYTGQGMLIAVIDDSFECYHQVFSEEPEQGKYHYTDIEKLGENISFTADAKTADIYKSGKIIFAYDYADRDSNLSCSTMTHGTRTAGAAAGKYHSEEGEIYQGIAYDSQLALFKAASDNSSTLSDDALIAALDDAAKLSPDVLNCSFGAPRTFASASVFDEIYHKIEQAGTYIIAAAGNDSYNSSAVSNKNLSSSLPDYGTISYPSSLNSVTSVGSVNTGEHEANFLTANQTEQIEYTDLLLNTNGVFSHSEFPFENLKEESDYLYIHSYGENKDYAEHSIKDKIIILDRGKINFTEKLYNAGLYHAKAVIIINNEEEDYAFSAEEINLPAVVIPKKYQNYFLEYPEGVLSVSQEKAVFVSSANQKVSSFSSYGVTADLRLKPDFCAAGTHIYTPFGTESYSFVSGTSLSSAYTAGAAAVLKQYLQNSEMFSSIYNETGNKLINILLMNHSHLLQYEDTELYYTPRVQGAGAINILSAAQTDSAVTSENHTAKIELGDNETGTYQTHFQIHNYSSEKRSYSFSLKLQTDKEELYSDGRMINTLTPVSLNEYSEIIFSKENIPVQEIEIEPNSSESIDLAIRLDSSYILAMKNIFPNGFYVDGYLFIHYMQDEQEKTLSMPLMAFCGNWSSLPIFDDSTVMNEQNALIGADNHIAAVAELGSGYPKYELGKNIFTGEYNSDHIYISHDTLKNYLDTQFAGSAFILPDSSLLRDAFHYTIYISDSNGKSLFNKDYGHLSAYISNDTEPYLNLLKAVNSDDLKNLFSGLEEGIYSYTVSAQTMDSDGSFGETKTLSYTFRVDSAKPKAKTPVTYTKGGKIYLELSASDNGKVQGFLLNTAVRNPNNQYSYSDSLESLMKNNLISNDAYFLVNTEYAEDGSVIYTYDITKLSSQLLKLQSLNTIEKLSETKIIVRAVDYAYNLSSPMTADTLAYGNIELIFKDQYQKPVENIEVSCNDLKDTSNQKGRVNFSKIIPGIYVIQITGLPENYELDKREILIYTSNYQINFSKTISVKYTGREIDDSSQEITETSLELTLRDSSGNESPKPPEPIKTNDNSFFALIFIGILLMISVISLLMSRAKRIY